MAELTAQECGELAGCAPVTFRSYSNRGQAPKPVRHVGRTPVWDEEEVKEWIKSRPRANRSA